MSISSSKTAWAFSRSLTLRGALLALAAIGGGSCGGGGGGGGPDAAAPAPDAPAPLPDTSLPDARPDAPPDAPALVAVRVEPGETLRGVELDTPTEQAFTATAVYADASEVDVTSSASWEVTSAALGSMDGATLQIPAFASRFVGSTTVVATYAGVAGRAQITVVAYRQTGADADVLVVLPQDDPAGAQTASITFPTSLQSMDVFLNMDTTGSMDGEISNLQDALTGTVIPGLTGIVTDTWIGMGAYEDFPISPYGEPSCYYGAVGGPDQPFELFSEVTGDAGALETAVGGLAIGGNAIGCGNDTPESAIEAMYQIATGEGLSGPGATLVAPNSSGVGGVGFRPGSLPVIVNVTDAISHDTASNVCGELYTDPSVTAVAHSEAEALAAIEGICGRVIQIVSQTGATCTPQSDGLRWTVALGSAVLPGAWDVAIDGRPAGCAAGACCTGANLAGAAANASGLCPLTYAISGTGVGLDLALVNAVEMLARFAPFDVTTAWAGRDSDEAGQALPFGTTTADFVDAVTPLAHGAVPVPGAAAPVLTATAFEGVIPGTAVTVAVQARNDFLAPATSPRLFVVPIRVLADGCRLLGERSLYVVVPPAPLPPA